MSHLYSPHILIKRWRSDRMFRNGIIFSFFSLINQGINFLLAAFILPRYILPGEYGELSLYTVTVTLTGFFISLNTIGIIGVYFFRTTQENIARYISVISYISIGMALLLSGFLLLGGSAIEQLVDLKVKYLWLALLVAYIQVYISINLEVWRLEEKPVKYGLYTMASALLNCTLTLVLVAVYQYGWLGRLYTQVIVALAFFVLSLIILASRNYLKFRLPEKSYFRTTIAFGLPLVPHAVSWWLRQSLDRYIINYFFNTTLTGLYSFAFNFANILMIIGTAFNASFSVTIYRKLSEGGDDTPLFLLKKIVGMILLFFVLGVFICVGARIFIPWVAPQYADSVVFLLPLCVAAFFQSIYSIFVSFLYYFKKTRNLMYITTSAALLHVVFSFALVRYSALWAAYLLLITNFLVALGVVCYSQKIYSLPWRQLFVSGNKK